MARTAWLVRTALVAAVLGLCLWVLRSADLHAVANLLGRVDWTPVAAAVAIHLGVSLSARVQRWAMLLAPLPSVGPAPRFWALTAVVLASNAANNVLPGRMGELLRTLQLRRHYPVTAVVSSQVVEKLVQAASLLVVALPFVLLVPSATPYRTAAASALCLVAFLAVLLLAFAHRLTGGAARAAGRGPAGAARRALGAVRLVAERAGYALRLMLRARTWSSSLAWSALADLADVAIIALCLWAVGLRPDPALCVAVLVAVNLASVVPSTPAQLGVFEAAAVLALGAMGVEPSSALGFAIVYHGVQMLPTTVAGVGLLGMRTAELTGLR